MGNARDSDRLLRAIGAIYDAALDPSLWTAALEASFDSCGGVAAQMSVRGPDKLEHFGCVSGIPPESHSEYMEHYAADDLRFVRLRSAAKGIVYSERDLITDLEIASSPVYHELLPKYGLGPVLVADLPAQAMWVFFSVLGPKELKRFDHRARATLQSLLPHFSRAVQIQLRLAGHEGVIASTHEVLDALPTGVVLLDARGAVVFANRSAIATAERCAPLRLGQAGARLESGRTSADLSRLIDKVLATARGEGGWGDGLVRTEDNSQRPVLLQVVPLPRSRERGRPGPWRGAEALLLIRSAKSESPVPHGTLARLYGLTPAEDQLAMLILAGERMDEIAEQRGVSIHTARTQTKAVLAKAEVNRQVEFIARTWSLLAGLSAS